MGRQDEQDSGGTKTTITYASDPFKLSPTSLMSTPSLTISFYPKILPATINGRKKEKGLAGGLVGLTDGEFGNCGGIAACGTVAIDRLNRIVGTDLISRVRN